MRWVVLFLVMALPLHAESADEVAVRHVKVTAIGVPHAYAVAAARIIAAAREECVARHGFDMPDVVTVQVEIGRKVRLWNDGNDTIHWVVRNERDLKRPDVSGAHPVYGLCHELGHLAMYRPIKDIGWLTGDGAESWAHYLGSMLEARVAEVQGRGLWPDPYDYRAEAARLHAALAGPSPDAFDRSAGAWERMATLAGPRGVAPLFAAWGPATRDALHPLDAARGALATPALRKWFDTSRGLLFVTPAASAFLGRAAVPVDGAQPHELAHDDGRAAGQRSLGCSVHAVSMRAPPGVALTAVRMHAARYGDPAAQGRFAVWVLDRDLKPFAVSIHDAKALPVDSAAWVTVELPTVLVPEEFAIEADFHSTASDGGYLSLDGAPGRASYAGARGELKPFTKGNWLLRAVVVAANPARRQGLRRGRMVWHSSKSVKTRRAGVFGGCLAVRAVGAGAGHERVCSGRPGDGHGAADVPAGQPGPRGARSARAALGPAAGRRGARAQPGHGAERLLLAYQPQHR